MAPLSHAAAHVLSVGGTTRDTGASDCATESWQGRARTRERHPPRPRAPAPDTSMPSSTAIVFNPVCLCPGLGRMHESGFEFRD
eukprot:4943928-Prymnesium_polylepis.2